MTGSRPCAAEQRGSRERGGGGGSAGAAGGMSGTGAAGRALAALLLAASVLSAALLAPGSSPTPGECALRPGPRGGDCPSPGRRAGQLWRSSARNSRVVSAALSWRGRGSCTEADPREDAGGREWRSSGFMECL